MAWQRRKEGRAFWHDLPGPRDWIEVQYVSQTDAWWAFCMTKGDDRPPGLGPFPSTEQAQAAAERAWLAAAGSGQDLPHRLRETPALEALRSA